MSYPELGKPRILTDDLGYDTAIAGDATRVISLVPSLTEAVAASEPHRLVGATDWCTHPKELKVSRVRGTKNPNLRTIRELAPHLVIANREENRELDVRRLRESGIGVYVTDIRTVPEALQSIERLWRQLQWDQPAWLNNAKQRWNVAQPAIHSTVAIAIWRDPWMVVGSDTFTGDLVRRLGYRNIFAESPQRYPTVDLAELDSSDVDLVVLPDEPYPFTGTDGPEAFERTRTALTSGRLLTWYGPSLIEPMPLGPAPPAN